MLGGPLGTSGESSCQGSWWGTGQSWFAIKITCVRCSVLVSGKGEVQGFLGAAAFVLGFEGCLEFGLADMGSSMPQATPAPPTGLCLCAHTRAHHLFCPTPEMKVLTACSADRDTGKLESDKGGSVPG